MQTHKMPVAGRISGTLPLLIFSGMLLLAACGTTPDVHYYLISAQPATTGADALPTGTVIGLGPLSLPEYLVRSQMVTRTSASRLQYHNEHRWAEPLADNIGRVLRENLAGRLNLDQVIAWPWQRNRKVDYQVTLDITRLDADSTGNVNLEGRWSLHKNGGSAPIAARHIKLTVPAADSTHDAVAIAHGEPLARLASDIAEQLLQSASAP